MERTWRRILTTFWVAPDRIPVMNLKVASLNEFPSFMMGCYICKFKRFTICGSLDFLGLGKRGEEGGWVHSLPLPAMVWLLIKNMSSYFITTFSPQPLYPSFFLELLLPHFQETPCEKLSNENVWRSDRCLKFISMARRTDWES